MRCLPFVGTKCITTINLEARTKNSSLYVIYGSYGKIAQGKTPKSAIFKKPGAAEVQNEKSDRLKKRQFDKQKVSDGFPAYIIEHEKTLANTPGCREKLAEFRNDLIIRNPNGKYEVNFKSPHWEVPRVVKIRPSLFDFYRLTYMMHTHVHTYIPTWGPLVV